MPTENYIKNRAMFVALDAEIDGIAAYVRKVAEALTTQRGKFMFANAAGGMPAEVALSPRQVSADAKLWPTPDKIQTLLVAWHQLKREVDGNWDALSQDEKAALHAPPWHSEARKW